MMAWLFGWLITAVGPILQKLFFDVSRRTVTLGIMVGLMVSGYLAFMASMSSLINGVQTSVPQTVLNVWSWVMPDNLYVTFLSIVTAKIFRFAYDKYHELIETSGKVLAA